MTDLITPAMDRRAGKGEPMVGIPVSGTSDQGASHLDRASLGGNGVLSGVRVVRKQATRERVLAAARDLFVEIGYEAATIRMIATRAGVATGSVFTTFASKLEILREVMEERLDGLYAELEKVVPHLRGTAADRLCSIMAVQYDFEMKRPRLFTAYLAANFEWTDTGEPVVTFGRNARLRGFMRQALEHGVISGDIRPDADLDLAMDVIIACYGFNYRDAVQRGLDAQGLIKLMDRQIVMVYDGLRAKAA
jgi:AcrR family transcriptional regulator